MRQSPVRMLVIDDDKADVRAVERAMKALHVPTTIETRRNGIEGLERLAQPSPPQLILLDLNTPKMSGLEFLAELRKRSGLPQPIVFVLSTSGRAKEREAAYSFHVAGYMQKRSAGPGFRDLAALIGRYLDLVDLPEFGGDAD